MKMIGLARLGRDAEVRYTPGGDPVANLSLAYVCGIKKEGEQYAPSQWIDAALWGKRAEKLAQFLTKGSVHCFTIRDVRMEKYTDKEGYDAYKLVGTVDDVELGPSNGERSSGGSSEGGGNAGTGARRPATAGAGAGAASKPAAPKPGGGFNDFEDDIPF